MSIRECVRCSAKPRKGSQCRNTTCIYSKFCNVHTKQLFDLYLKESSIPGSGTGLFTSKFILSKTTIANYTGLIKTQAQNDVKPSGYALAIPHGKVLDDASTQSGLARYANDCRAGNKRSGQCKGSNAKFSTLTRDGVTSVGLTSTKLIPANSEIFVSYGRGYWNKSWSRVLSNKMLGTVPCYRTMTGVC